MNRNESWDRTDRLYVKMDRERRIQEALKDLRAQREAVVEKIKQKVARDEADRVATIDDFKKDDEYKSLTKSITKLSDGGFMSVINDRVTQSIGDVVSDKTKTVVERLLGSTVDLFISQIIDYAYKTKLWMFNQSKTPLTQNELKNWCDIMVNCIEGFGKLVGGQAGFESRGKDMNSRAFDAEDQSGNNQDQILCECLLNHYAAQCDYYAQMIERRRAYYKEDSEVAFVAGQLKDWLLEFKNIVVSVKSLKDVSAKFGQNSPMIVQTVSNIKKLFEKLSGLVSPPQYGLNVSSTKTSSSSYSDSSLSGDYSGMGGRSKFPQEYGSNDYLG